ncbi:unnamed protein product [Durusdinium trenchii]|uniref:DUF7869 domain-containing protein n=2 Tax=Durusdinium trenchii TaxID=1381693 RepID=A0ABP0T087_9DINO
MPNNFSLRSERAVESPFPSEKEEQADDIERVLNSMSRMLQTTWTDADVHLVGPGTFKGPVRSLPHATRTELYYTYLAFCESRQMQHASYSTFLRVANKILKPGIRNGHLRFRKVNEHGQCDTCFALRQNMTRARTTQQKEEARQEHHRHVLAQWLDRQIYWSFRSLAHTFFATLLMEGIRTAEALAVASSCFCVAIDGMDQAKFCVPRFRQRQAKSAQKLFRPRLHVAGCWAHGSSLTFNIANEDLKKNSATQCEILARCIQDTLNRHGCLPHGINLQQDNTCREGKNQYDLDQIFSQQAAMLARHEFATPDDVVALMDDTFKPESAADEIRKQSRRVKVESYARKLDQVADWKMEEIRGSPPHAADVILIAKKYMATCDPLRVICLVPASKCCELRASLQQPVGLDPRRPISEKVRKNILSVAPYCCEKGMITRDGLAYLLGWVQNELPQVPRPSEYPFLNLNRYPIDLPEAVAGDWAPPGRFRVFQLVASAEESDDDVPEDAIVLDDDRD